jgi:hypothetical protein
MKKVDINNFILLFLQISSDITDYKITFEKNKSFLSYGNSFKQKLPNKKCKILGEVTSSKIGFDVKNIIDKKIEPTGFGGNRTLYYDYLNEEWVSSYVLSFYSFLSVNGFFFFNNVTRKDADFGTEDWNIRWKEREEKILKGKILVIISFDK